MTIENPNTNFSDPKKSWDETIKEAFEKKDSEEKASLERLVTEAVVNGKEEFDVDRLLQHYYPNDLTDDENLIRSRVESYRSDYYHSSAMTLEEWAKNREQIEAQGDS